MSKNLARLRKLSAQRGDTGTAESRDTLITAFLEELETVICREAADNIPDSTLNCLYMGWVSSVNTEEHPDQRRGRLVSAVVIFPTTEAQAPSRTANVKSIYG